MRLSARQLQAIGVAVVMAGWPALKAARAVYDAWNDLNDRVAKLERRACKMGGPPVEVNGKKVPTIDWQRECKP